MSALFLFYSSKNEMPSEFNTVGMPATYIILYRGCLAYGLCTWSAKSKISYSPGPLYSPDDNLGYALNPGAYEMKYEKPNDQGGADVFKSFVTVNQDKTRYVGKHISPPKRKVLIFGDSFVFGEGVSDEQTFTYLLQSTFPESEFILYAAGGYSLAQAYINFEKIKQTIAPGDVLILGYADIHKKRHVAAPSRLWEFGDPGTILPPDPWKHPRFSLSSDNKLSLDFVILHCKFNSDYCAQQDPSEDYMNQVTSKLIEEIAIQSKGQVSILHFLGSKEDPVLHSLPANVELISATSSDFDYKIRDDVMGFDTHPGPFWHYAIYRKLASWIRSQPHAEQGAAWLAVKRPDIPLVTQELRYHAPRAAEVWLLWGINGWQPVPDAVRPPGTILFPDRIMHTPLVRKGDTFTNMLRVPPGTVIDHGFIITKTEGGTAVNIWEAGRSYTAGKHNGRIEVKSTATVVPN
jgi:hypothetical protein